MNAPAAHDAAWRLPPARTLGRAAIAAAVYYAVAVLILHLVQRDLNPIDHFTSEYVLGRAGFLMTTTFFVWALGIASLAVALRRILVPSRSSKAGLVLLWIGVLGIVGAGVFATDPRILRIPTRRTVAVDGAVRGRAGAHLLGRISFENVRLRRGARLGCSIAGGDRRSGETGVDQLGLR